MPLNKLENVWHISFKGRETCFVELDATRAVFLEAEDYFPNSRDIEFCLDNAENL